ncbi:MAG: hypothetical protein QOG98_2645, partial [Pseudonocardiales bacterium]|nr:hypothetical protein [Pseudonocardiales bacterium]
MSTELADARAPKLRRALTITAIGAVLAATAVVISAPAQAIGPTTIRVDTGGINAPTCGGATQQCLTIQYAIDKANSGDTVQVAAGTYNEIVTIAKGINLQGAGAADTFIDGTGTTS